MSGRIALLILLVLVGAGCKGAGRSSDIILITVDTLRADQRRSEEIEALLMEKLERWEALEARATASGP